MKQIVYLLTGFFLLTYSHASEAKSLNSDTFKVLQKQASQKKEDSLITISGLQWHTNVDTAFDIAAKEKKRVIIMVGENYCRWCTKMKERTFTDARVREKLAAYTLVSIKRSDKSSIKHVPTFDGNIPSLFFMNSDRELIEPVVGYFVADDFLSYIKEIEEL